MKKLLSLLILPLFALPVSSSAITERCLQHYRSLCEIEADEDCDKHCENISIVPRKEKCLILCEIRNKRKEEKRKRLRDLMRGTGTDGSCTENTSNPKEPWKCDEEHPTCPPADEVCIALLQKKRKCATSAAAAEVIDHARDGFLDNQVAARIATMFSNVDAAICQEEAEEMPAKVTADSAVAGF